MTGSKYLSELVSLDMLKMDTLVNLHNIFGRKNRVHNILLIKAFPNSIRRKWMGSRELMSIFSFAFLKRHIPSMTIRRKSKPFPAHSSPQKSHLKELAYDKKTCK